MNLWIACLVLLLLLVLLAAASYLMYAPAAAPALAGGTLAQRQLPARRGARSYLTYVPGDLVPDSPLVIMLHGARQGPAAIRQLAGPALERQARVCGFAVAYPAGHAAYWNDGYTPTRYRRRVEGTDDVAFMGALIDAMAAEHAIDPQRVFVLGYGNGGQMAYRLAMEMPQRLAGAAVIAANLAVDGSLEAIRRGLPVPLLIVNGTADRWTPYAGGALGVLGSRGGVRLRSAHASAEYFATLAGAQADPQEGYLPTVLPRLAPVRSTWSNKAGVAVALYSVEGGGHVFHQPCVRQPRYLGRMNPGFDVAACACEFWGL